MLKAMIAAWLALAVVAVSVDTTPTVEASQPVTLADLCPV